MNEKKQEEENRIQKYHEKRTLYLLPSHENEMITSPILFHDLHE